MLYEWQSNFRLLCFFVEKNFRARLVLVPTIIFSLSISFCRAKFKPDYALFSKNVWVLSHKFSDIIVQKLAINQCYYRPNLNVLIFAFRNTAITTEPPPPSHARECCTATSKLLNVTAHHKKTNRPENSRCLSSSGPRSPLFVAVPARRNMLNIPKSASMFFFRFARFSEFSGRMCLLHDI